MWHIKPNAVLAMEATLFIIMQMLYLYVFAYCDVGENFYIYQHLPRNLLPYQDIPLSADISTVVVEKCDETTHTIINDFDVKLLI